VVSSIREKFWKKLFKNVNWFDNILKHKCFIHLFNKNATRGGKQNLAFGVRKCSVPIPADTEFYSCPLCDFITADKNAMIKHLVAVHKVKRKDAKVLVEAT
jgi:hypothetical protein